MLMLVLMLASLVRTGLKGPLKYLVAKLHGCYPGATLRCNKHKKTLFAYNFFINVLLYGYNM